MVFFYNIAIFFAPTFFVPEVLILFCLVLYMSASLAFCHAKKIVIASALPAGRQETKRSLRIFRMICEFYLSSLFILFTLSPHLSFSLSLLRPIALSPRRSSFADCLLAQSSRCLRKFKMFKIV